eukprot:4726820-Pyramimonas_sp.AAC.1
MRSLVIVFDRPGLRVRTACFTLVFSQDISSLGRSMKQCVWESVLGFWLSMFGRVFEDAAVTYLVQYRPPVKSDRCAPTHNHLPDSTLKQEGVYLGALSFAASLERSRWSALPTGRTNRTGGKDSPPMSTWAAGRMGAAAGASDGDKWRTGVVRGWPTAPIGRSHSIDEGPEGPTTSPPCPCIP